MSFLVFCFVMGVDGPWSELHLVVIAPGTNLMHCTLEFVKSSCARMNYIDVVEAHL